MIIRRDDRVSTVLRQDESLIEVFVSLSNVFERLHKPAMRKVMSRLVTVEQAARIGGVDPDELVSRLNVAMERKEERPMTNRDRATAGPARAGELPAVLQSIAAELIVEADVRDDLRRGLEPFSRIMTALKSVPQGGALVVRAIFEPVPLYAVLGKQGFAYHTERLADDDWRIWFYHGDGGTPVDEASAPSAAPAAEDPGVVVLDVRGLEPPEPMVRTLAALESLPAGATLLQINVRVPQFLLPLLEERGFTYEVREQGPELVRLFIRRAATGGAAS